MADKMIIKFDQKQSFESETEESVMKSRVARLRSFNPLSPSIKLQILLLCFHTFLTEVVGRSC